MIRDACATNLLRQDVRRLQEGRSGAAARGRGLAAEAGAAQKLKTTRVNGVAEKLQAVSDELDALPDGFDEVSRRRRRARIAAASIAGTERVARARLRHRHRHRHRAQPLLALEQARSRRALRLHEPHPLGDRRDLREARLHLGRQVVPLRHHAFRVPAGDCCGGAGKLAGRAWVRCPMRWTTWRMHAIEGHDAPMGPPVRGDDAGAGRQPRFAFLPSKNALIAACGSPVL